MFFQPILSGQRGICCCLTMPIGDLLFDIIRVRIQSASGFMMTDEMSHELAEETLETVIKEGQMTDAGLSDVIRRVISYRSQKHPYQEPGPPDFDDLPEPLDPDEF